jgi:hypothetical protein
MKNVTKQYHDLLEGKMPKANFLRNVKMMFPNFIGSNTSVNDAISILKSKRILSEATTGKYGEEYMNTQEMEKYVREKLLTNRNSEDAISQIKYYSKRNGFDDDEFLKDLVDDIVDQLLPRTESINESKTNSGFTYLDNKIERDPADEVNPYSLKIGVQNELSKMSDISGNAYQVALEKAAKNLKKDPHFYSDLQFANFKEVKKYDEKLQMKKVSSKDKKETGPDGHLKKALKKNEVANTKETNKENKKGKPKGVEIMKENVLSELKSVKKKEAKSLKEDTHWKYSRGSEINTPEGPGTVEDIIGGTISVKLDSGVVKDFQVNVLDKMDRAAHFAAMPNKFSSVQKPFEEKIDKKTEIVKKLKEFFSKMKSKKQEAVDVVTAQDSEGDTKTVATVPAGKGKDKAQRLKSQGVTSATSQTLK